MATTINQKTNYTAIAMSVLAAIYTILSIFGVNVSEALQVNINEIVTYLIYIAVIVISWFTGKTDETTKVE